MAQGCGAIQDDARPLGGVLVRINAHTGDTLDLKIKQGIYTRPDKGQDKATQARVHRQSNVVSLRQFPQFLNRINGPLWIVGCRRINHDGIGRIVTFDSVGVQRVPGLCTFDDYFADAVHFTRLVHSDVGGATVVADTADYNLDWVVYLGNGRTHVYPQIGKANL